MEYLEIANATLNVLCLIFAIWNVHRSLGAKDKLDSIEYLVWAAIFFGLASS